MPNNCLLKLASTVLKNTEDDEDRIKWLEVNRGKFSIASAYSLAVGGNEEGNWLGRKLIWKAEVNKELKNLCGYWLMINC